MFFGGSMKRPAFQFYPSDWQGNSNLRRCTHEEKGVWVDVLCLLHDQEEYGVARWPLKEIAQAVGCSPSKLRGLVTKGVLKGADSGEACAALIYVPRSGRRDGDPVTLIPEQPGPVWYSSRMVRDEYKRCNAGASTRFGAQNHDKTDTAPDDAAPPRHSPTRRQGERRGDDEGDGSSSSSSSSEDIAADDSACAPEKSGAVVEATLDPKIYLRLQGIINASVPLHKLKLLEAQFNRAVEVV